MEKLSSLFFEIGSKFNPIHLFFVFFPICVFVVAAIGRYFVVCYVEGSKPSIKSLMEYAFPIHAWRKRSGQIDLWFYVVTKTGVMRFILANNIIIAILFSTAISWGLAQVFGVQQKGDLSLSIYLVAGVLVFVTRDFMNFFIHYLEHKVPMLWEFHKVHHSATFLNPLSAHRFHPVQAQVDALAEGFGMALIFGPISYFYDFTAIDMALVALNFIWIIQLLILEPLQHSHVSLSFGKFENLICSPSMHHVHHSSEERHWDKNFGSMITLWDKMFATFYKPVMGESITLGVSHGETDDYDSVWKCYVVPFRKAFRHFRGASSARDAELGNGSHQAIAFEADHRTMDAMAPSLGKAGH